MKAEGANSLLLTISVFWSSSRWPLATKMSSRRQRSIPLGGRYRQVSLYILPQYVGRHFNSVHIKHEFNNFLAIVIAPFAIKNNLLCIISCRPDNMERKRIYLITGPLWGKSSGHRRIPRKRTVILSVDVFFVIRLNNLNQQSCYR